MKELLIRFVVGGLVVSCFAVLGDLFKPKRFAGLFAAAPSVALATLALTVAKQGQSFAATETRSMIGGAVALLLYSASVSWLMFRRRISALPATLFLMVVWFAVAFVSWAIWLRQG